MNYGTVLLTINEGKLSIKQQVELVSLILKHIKHSRISLRVKLCPEIGQHFSRIDADNTVGQQCINRSCSCFTNYNRNRRFAIYCQFIYYFHIEKDLNRLIYFFFF